MASNMGKDFKKILWIYFPIEENLKKAHEDKTNVFPLCPACAFSLHSHLFTESLLKTALLFWDD